MCCAVSQRIDSVPVPDLDLALVDGIAVVTFNRPRKANAISLPMQLGLTDYILAAADDPDCSAIVLSGGDGGVFSAGADLRETDATLPVEEFAEVRSSAMFRLLTAIIECPKPVVAEVNGHAVGSGFLICLAADARVAARSASFALPEIERGQPTFAGSVLVERRLNGAMAQDLVLTGRRMSVDEGYACGMVRSLHDIATLRDTAVDLARILARWPVAFAQNKQWINAGLVGELERARLRSAEVRRERWQDQAMDQRG